MRWVLPLLLAVLISATTQEPDQLLRTISSLELIGDWPAAIDLARSGTESHPESSDLYAAYVLALARGGKEQEAVEAYHSYLDRFPNAPRADVAEAVAWGVIQSGARSAPLLTQLAGLIGGVMTQGMPAVDLVVAALNSPNSLVRSVGAELSGHMGDRALHDKLMELLREERVPEVRVEVIRAIGRLHIDAARPKLEEVIAASVTPIDERLAAIESVVVMTEEIEERELCRLLSHPRAGMRRLGCQIVAELDLSGQVELILPLLQDTRADVRIEVLNTLGLLRVPGVVEQIQPLLDDPDPMVSITASWLLTLHDPEEGMHRLARWLVVDHVEWARRAAAAVAATGRHGAPLARQWVEIHPDSFVRANLALGLIGQREETERASELLYDLFEKEKGRWMWDREQNELFNALVPSRVRYKGTIPNYPEVVNQTTRLDLVSVLASVGHPRVDQVVRNLLRERQWGITGLAAVTLLEEGDEVAIDLVRDLLNDEDHKIRVQAALALAIWGRDPSAVGVLVEAYPQADRELKLIILEGIGRVGAAEALPFLIDHMGEPFQLLRLFSASAVIQSLNQSGGKGLEQSGEEK